MERTQQRTARGENTIVVMEARLDEMYKNVIPLETVLPIYRFRVDGRHATSALQFPTDFATLVRAPDEEAEEGTEGMDIVVEVLVQEGHRLGESVSEEVKKKKQQGRARTCSETTTEVQVYTKRRVRKRPWTDTRRRRRENILGSATGGGAWKSVMRTRSSHVGKAERCPWPSTSLDELHWSYSVRSTVYVQTWGMVYELEGTVSERKEKKKRQTHSKDMSEGDKWG